jgi:mannose-6-phosphate isomerase
MHLFEAALAWAQLEGFDSPWGEWADELAYLALERFVDPTMGALPEHFDGDWRPLPDSAGLLIEPGHQFEWSWLLSQWSRYRDEPAASDVALRLAEIGEQWGLHPRFRLVIDAIDGDFQVRDATMRLWPQTERAKAWHAIAISPRHSPDVRRVAASRMEAACEGIEVLLTGCPKGLWWDLRTNDGQFVDEPVRASSLYHLTCAVYALSQERPSL